jgi:hypothetical protein
VEENDCNNKDKNKSKKDLILETLFLEKRDGRHNPKKNEKIILKNIELETPPTKETFIKKKKEEINE